MAEKQMVDVFILGKKYSVPSTLTIMDAMEYAGYQLIRGCGCRSGFVELVPLSIEQKEKMN